MLEEKSYQDLKISEVTALKEKNKLAAKKFDCKFSGEATTEKVWATVTQKGIVIFHAEFTDGDLHERIALLHWQIDIAFNQMYYEETRRVRKENERLLREKKQKEKKTMYQQVHPEVNPDPEPTID